MRIVELLEDRKLGHVVNAAMKAHKTLSNDAHHAIDRWQAMNWETGELAKAHGSNSELYAEIQNAFQPVRDILKSKFGDTIPLSRGESFGNEYSKDRALYSWTYSPEIAADFGGKQKEYKVLTNQEVRQAVDKYNQTGFVNVLGFKLKQIKDEKYFNIYDRNNQHITDGDDVVDFITSENNDRKEANERNTKRGTVYTQEMPIDKIVWVTNELGSQEFIVAQAPDRSQG